MKGSGGAARSAREAWAHACLGPVPFWAPCSALVSPAGLLVVLLWAALVAAAVHRIVARSRTGVFLLDFACFAPPPE